MILLDIYYVMPWYIQNILCSFKGWQIKRRRYNSNFYKELCNYEKYSYQQDELLIHLVEVMHDIPAYKTILEKISDFSNPYEVIKTFPVINKQYVKEHLSEFINPKCKEPLFIAHTSGTTGAGLSFPYTIKAENKQWAVWWRYRRRLGIELNTWCGWFGGQLVVPKNSVTPPYWRINYPLHQVMFSAYHLNQATVKDYYLEIRHRKLTWLHGYPSQLSLLASLILEQGFLPIDEVVCVTFGAENLLENQKQIIRRAFPHAVLRQHYGLSEGVANISENTEGELVVDQDFCYVEFVPILPDKPEVCRIIGTGFNNPVFPLVRYDTGDIAVIERKADGKIKIISIDGRLEDFIQLPNGVKLGRLDHIFKELTKVREAQIVQEAIDLLRIRVVKGDGYDEMEENKLWQELRSRIGEEVAIVIDYTEKIERTKSGKLRFVISKLK